MPCIRCEVIDVAGQLVVQEGLCVDSCAAQPGTIGEWNNQWPTIARRDELLGQCSEMKRGVVLTRRRPSKSRMFEFGQDFPVDFRFVPIAAGGETRERPFAGNPRK